MTADIVEIPREKNYKVSEVAKHWGCSLVHVYTACDRGELRHFRLGRAIRIPASAIAEYQQKVAA